MRGAWCRLGASKNRKQNAGKGNNMATGRQGEPCATCSTHASHVARVALRDALKEIGCANFNDQLPRQSLS